jgi:glutaredoxin-like protein
MEKLLNSEIQNQIKEMLAEMKEPVSILFFGSETECAYCEEIKQLLSEVAELSEKIDLKVYDFEKDAELRDQFKVEQAPVFILAGQEEGKVKDFGIRFYGIPSGHEFSTFVNDLLLVSGRDSGLMPETRKFLAELKKPIHLQVFVTPTCPYCPQAVILAHRMALESVNVTADMVEATEFPELAERFGVSGVPQTTINMGAGSIVGAYPENQLLAEIKSALAL